VCGVVACGTYAAHRVILARRCASQHDAALVCCVAGQGRIVGSTGSAEPVERIDKQSALQSAILSIRACR